MTQPVVPLHVGFLIDSFAVGGTELNAIKVAEGLTRRAVPITVFHFQNIGPLRVRYEALGVELIHVPLHGLVSASAYRCAEFVYAESRKRNIALIHSHCVYSNILSLAVNRLGLRKLPILVSRRWTGYSARKGLSTINRLAQSAASAVLVNSPSLRRVVQQESPGSKPVYVPNLLPDESFRAVSESQRSEMRAARGLPLHARTVGEIARLESVKDHSSLLKAWPLVLEQVPSAALVIIGNGSLRGALEREAAQLNISSSVHFTGEILPHGLPHALLDVCVLSSLDEGFPNTLLEAMAQGVPVVSTNVGGVPDLVADGKNGLLVPSKDPAAMAAAILKVLQQKIDVAAMTAEGLKTALTHSEEAVIESLMALYHQIAPR